MVEFLVLIFDFVLGIIIGYTIGYIEDKIILEKKRKYHNSVKELSEKASKPKAHYI